MAKLLLLEDDPAIARTVIYALERDGFTVLHCLLLGDALEFFVGGIAVFGFFVVAVEHR